MNHLLNDVGFGLRSLWRRPGFAVVAVSTLALGMGATIPLVSVIGAVLLRSFGYADPGRLVQISGKNSKGRVTGVAIGDIPVFEARTGLFAAVGATRVQTFTLRGPHEPHNIYGRLVSRHLFDALGARPLLGRLFVESDFASSAPPTAVLAYKLWQSDLDGDPAIIGRRLMMNGTEYTVVGVMRPEFQLHHPVFQVWSPWRFTPAELSDHSAHGFDLLGRLASGISLQAAQSRAEALSQSLAREYPANYTGWRAMVTAFDAGSVENLRPALLMLLGAVVLVLLIACFNVANLMMARGIERSREIAVRAALGAGRRRLAGQLLTESMVVAVLGGALGLLLARAFLAVLLATLPAGPFGILPRLDEARLDGRALAISLVLTLVAGLLFGVVPALRLSARNVEDALKEGGRGQSGGPRRRLLSGPIVLEAALSVILLVGSGLLIRSFTNVLRVNPGFRPEHVLTVQVPSAWAPLGRDDRAETERKQQRFRDLLDRVSHLPGIGAAAMVTVLPMGHVEVRTIIHVEGRTEPAAGEDQPLQYRAASPDYFRVMGIPVLKGRAFAESDQPGAPDVAVVSEAMARRYWPGEDPVGKRFSFSDGGHGPWTTVVGEVGSVHYNRLTAEPEGELYTPYRQRLMAAQVATLVLRTPLDPRVMAAPVRAAIRAYDPGQPIADVMSMSQVLSDSMAQQRLYTLLLALFASLALLLAAAGIFSVISWTVNQRTHEIGIRMALGAEPGRLVRSMMRRALIETAAGSMLGLGGAAALTGILKRQLFGITATDPATFAAAAVLLAAVATLAAYLPARHAAHLDPLIALRDE